MAVSLPNRLELVLAKTRCPMSGRDELTITGDQDETLLAILYG